MTRQNNLDVGQDQNVGISGRAAQEDAVKVFDVTTDGGLALTVAVVADGESAYGMGEEAARLAVSRIRRSLREAQGEDVNRLLHQALHRAQRALRRKIEENGRPDLMAASVTVAAVHKKRLYLAHVGNTRAYLVRGDDVFLLTRDHVNGQGPGAQLNQALGLTPDLNADVGIPAGIELATASGGGLPLQRGDHVVLCSDGLVQQRPDNRGPVLDPADEMPRILNNPNTPALEAARTLVSLAVGRKASDNVSAAVISLPAPARLWFLAGAAGALLLLLLGALLLFGNTPLTAEPTATPTASPTPIPTPTATPVDIGYASIRAPQGSPQLIGSDGAELPGNRVEAGQTVKTEATDQAEIIFEGGGRLYLGPNGQLRFDQIDLETAPDQTTLTLLTGELLLHQPDGGDTITVTGENGAVLVILNGQGTLAIGQNGAAACYAGTCERGDGTPLSGDLSAAAFNSYDFWQTQCGCLNE